MIVINKLMKALRGPLCPKMFKGT